MNKRWIYFVLGILLLAGAVFFGVKALFSVYAPEDVSTELYVPDTPEPEPTPAPAPAAPEATAPPAETVKPEQTPEPTPYISPVDFAGLQAVNPDIYGWLEIGDTNISYPIVQSRTDDTFYLDHNSDGAYSANGAIYSESKYNSGDMSDPVTILYGHHMKSGAMFGQLQRYYADAESFADHAVIKVYTPEATLEYGVFSAVPYSSRHILYYNDFSDPEVFRTFFDSVFVTRDLSAHFNEAYAPQAGDRVLILSTCLSSDNSRRFLVMATLLA